MNCNLHKNESVHLEAEPKLLTGIAHTHDWFTNAAKTFKLASELRHNHYVFQPGSRFKLIE